LINHGDVTEPRALAFEEEVIQLLHVPFFFEYSVNSIDREKECVLAQVWLLFVKDLLDSFPDRVLLILQ